MGRASRERRLAAGLAPAAALAVALVAFGVAGPQGVAPAGAAGAVQMPDTASLTGTVAADTPFTAARVFIRNVDRRMLYMAYTQAGRFRAVALFPGRYEISVRAPGLESDVQHLVLNAGDSPSLALSLRAAGDAAAPAAPGGGGELPAARAATEYLPYDELYPPGPGRDIAERTCMPCHGGNFLSSRPSRPAAWEAAIDKMFGKALANRPSLSYGDGIISYRDAQRRFSLEDRETLLAYLVEHFGPDAPPRHIRIEQQMPVDEAALGKALYIEYYLPEDAPGEGVNAPEFAGLSANFRRTPRRPGCAVRPARQRVADGPRLPPPAGEAGPPYRRVHGLRAAGPEERHPRGQHRPGGASSGSPSTAASSPRRPNGCWGSTRRRNAGST